MIGIEKLAGGVRAFGEGVTGRASEPRLYDLKLPLSWPGESTSLSAPKKTETSIPCAKGGFTWGKSWKHFDQSPRAVSSECFLRFKDSGLSRIQGKKAKESWRGPRKPGLLRQGLMGS